MVRYEAAASGAAFDGGAEHDAGVVAGDGDEPAVLEEIQVAGNGLVAESQISGKGLDGGGTAHRQRAQDQVEPIQNWSVVDGGHIRLSCLPDGLREARRRVFFSWR